MEKKPWIEGSLEVLELAIEQYYMSIGSDSERDKYRYLRVSLINTDDAAELAIKAFIQYHKYQKVTRNFHENLSRICRKGSPCKIEIPKELESKIRYCHGLRDTFYHQGYSFTISHIEVLDYIEKVIQLFRLLFQDDLDSSIQHNDRRQLLLGSIELEKALFDLCELSRMKFEGQELITIVQNMANSKLISGNTRDAVEELIGFREKLVPKTYSSEIGDTYTAVISLADTLEKIKSAIENRKKNLKFDK